jgi:hypothetical protein
MPSITDGHSLFAQSSTPSAMAVDYSRVASTLAVLAPNGAYLVSLCVHLVANQKMGLGTLISTGSHLGTMPNT